MPTNIVTGPGASKYLRECRLNDMLAAIAAWQASTCIERAYWRSTARMAIAEFKTRHLLPERAAFLAAARNRIIQAPPAGQSNGTTASQEGGQR